MQVGWGQEWGSLPVSEGPAAPGTRVPSDSQTPESALGKVKGDTCRLASTMPLPWYFKYPLSEALPWNLFSSVILLTQPGVGLSEVINLSI